MLGKGTRRGTGISMRHEAATVIKDARATGKRVNVIREGMEAEQSVEEEVRIRIAVAAGAPRSLVLTVRDALLPVRPHATVSVAAAADAAIAGGNWDAAVVVADGADPAVADVARTFARAGLPVALVGESTLDIPNLGLVGSVANRVTAVAAASSTAIEEGLASWLVRTSDKGMAMAASFPFARAAQAEVLARECAAQNAAVGAFNLVPGSDLPVMAANQVRLAITYAAMYGVGFTPARIFEMLSVVGSSVGYRSVAKSMGHALPGLGLVVRGGVGYAGTLFTARTLARYYARVDAEGGAARVTYNSVRRGVRMVSDILLARMGLPAEREA